MSVGLVAGGAVVWSYRRVEQKSQWKYVSFALFFFYAMIWSLLSQVLRSVCGDRCGDVHHSRSFQRRTKFKMHGGGDDEVRKNEMLVRPLPHLRRIDFFTVDSRRN